MEVVWRAMCPQKKIAINQPCSDLEFQRAEEKEADEPISVEAVHVLPI